MFILQVVTKLFISKTLYKSEHALSNRTEGICYYMYCAHVEVLENLIPCLIYTFLYTMSLQSEPVKCLVYTCTMSYLYPSI